MASRTLRPSARLFAGSLADRPSATRDECHGAPTTASLQGQQLGRQLDWTNMLERSHAKCVLERASLLPPLDRDECSNKQERENPTPNLEWSSRSRAKPIRPRPFGDAQPVMQASISDVRSQRKNESIKIEVGPGIGAVIAITPFNGLSFHA